MIGDEEERKMKKTMKTGKNCRRNTARGVFGCARSRNEKRTERSGLTYTPPPCLTFDQVGLRPLMRLIAELTGLTFRNAAIPEDVVNPTLRATKKPPAAGFGCDDETGRLVCPHRRSFASRFPAGTTALVFFPDDRKLE